MTKELQVVESFLNLEPGDILTLSEDGAYYEHSVAESFGGDEQKTGFKSSFNSSTKISLGYAKELLKNEFVVELMKKTSYNEESKPFVNVFVEIDNLLDKYTKEYNSLDETYKESPACLKVEASTVLSNLIEVLTYLKELKK